MGRNLIIAAIILIIYGVIQLTLLNADRFELPEGVDLDSTTTTQSDSGDSTSSTDDSQVRTPNFSSSRVQGDELIAFVCIDPLQLQSADPRSDICLINGMGRGEINLTRDLGHKHVTGPRINSQGEIVFSCWGGELGEQRSICYVRHDGSLLSVIDLPYEAHIFDAPDISDGGEIAFACGFDDNQAADVSYVGWQVCWMSNFESPWQVISNNDFGLLSAADVYGDVNHPSPAMSDSGLVIYKCTDEDLSIALCIYSWQFESGEPRIAFTPLNGLESMGGSLSVNGAMDALYSCLDEPNRICGASMAIERSGWKITLRVDPELVYEDPYVHGGGSSWALFTCDGEICRTDLQTTFSFFQVTDSLDDVKYSDPVISSNERVFSICAEAGATPTICEAQTLASGTITAIFALKHIAQDVPENHERMIDITLFAPISTPGDID